MKFYSRFLRIRKWNLLFVRSVVLPFAFLLSLLNFIWYFDDLLLHAHSPILSTISQCQRVISTLSRGNKFVHVCIPPPHPIPRVPLCLVVSVVNRRFLLTDGIFIIIIPYQQHSSIILCALYSHINDYRAKKDKLIYTLKVRKPHRYLQTYLIIWAVIATIILIINFPAFFVNRHNSALDEWQP